MEWVRRYRLALVVSFVVVGAVIALSFMGGEDDPAVLASDLLAASSAEIHIELVSTVPEDVALAQGNPVDQEIVADGTVAFSEQRAALNYDYRGLLNVAGTFGHLESSEVVFSDDLTYVEIYNDGPRWVVFESHQVTDTYLGRLREMVLSSPLMLPELLSNMRAGEPKGPDGLSGTLNLRDIDHPNADAFAELGATEASIEVRLDSGFPTRVRFTTSLGGADRADPVELVVVVELEEQEISEIEVPAEDSVRDFDSFLD